MQRTVFLCAASTRQQSYKHFAKVMHGVIGGSAKKRGRAVGTYWRATEGIRDGTRIATAVEAHLRLYPNAAKRTHSYVLSKPASPMTIKEVMKAAVAKPAKKPTKPAKKPTKKLTKPTKKATKPTKKLTKSKTTKVTKKTLKLKKPTLTKKIQKVTMKKSVKPTKGSAAKLTSKPPSDYQRFYNVILKGGHVKGTGNEKIKKVASLWKETKNVTDFKKRVEQAISATQKNTAGSVVG